VAKRIRGPDALPRRRRDRSLLRLIATLAVLNIALLALEIPRHSGFGPNWIALEALVLVGGFSLLPRRRWMVLLAWCAGIAFAVLTLLALADALARTSVNRPLNLYLDHPLGISVYHLVATNISPVAATLGAIALLAALAASALAVAWLLGGLAGSAGRTRPAPGVVALAILVTGLLAMVSGHAVPGPPRAITPGITLVADQVRWAVRTHIERRDFGEQLVAVVLEMCNSPASTRADMASRPLLLPL
jgi:hypothetical protein